MNSPPASARRAAWRGPPTPSRSGVRRSSLADKTVGAPVRTLYAIPEAVVLLSLSQTQIYELIRSDRLHTVTQGRRRLVPAEALGLRGAAAERGEVGSGRDRAA